MCHNLRNAAAGSPLSHSQASTTSLRGVHHAPAPQPKSNFRLSPFRRVAKSARINLNRYWGLLSTKLQHQAPKLMTIEDSINFQAEMEQNRINELLEAHASASSQNSLNSSFEEGYLTLAHPRSPQPARRFVRQPQRSLYSSTSSCTSPAPSSVECFSFDDSSSQDSVYL